MGWIFDTVAVVLFVIGGLFAVENWRAWLYNSFKREDGDTPARYYPLVGCIVMFYALSLALRPGYELWAFTALLLDFGCLPLAITCLWRGLKRHK